MTHDKKSLANEYCLCRKIPHRWVGGMTAQLVLGSGNQKDVIYSIWNLTYAEIIATIDRICEYDDFGRFVGMKERFPWKEV